MRPSRKVRFAPLALGLVAAALGACGSQASQAPPQQPGPYAYQPVAPPPTAPLPAPAQLPTLPPVLGSAGLAMLAAARNAIPCPMPGLPPEVAALIDCSAIRIASNSVEYVPRVFSTATLPGTVDHRATGLVGPVKSQNPVGACAGFAISSVMDNAIRRRGRGDVVSPMHVFATYTRENDMGALRGKSMTTDPVWPFNPATACRLANPVHGGYCQSQLGIAPGSGQGDPMLLGERARADSMGAFRIDVLEFIEKSEVDQLALLVAEGEAVWIALAFDQEAWKHKNVQSGYLPWYPPQDGLGHAVVLQGYRMGPTGREFLFQNSWGTDWGMGGYLWIPESMLRSHLLHGYRVRVTDAGAAPYVPPSGPQVPAAGGCPQGTTGMFGVCLPLPGGGALPGGGTLPIPSGFPSALPSGTVPPAGSCPAGTLPNPLAPGQCVAMPQGF